VRFGVVLACLFIGGVAVADSARVRWRGVTVEGHAPASLQSAAAAHVGVALKQLGSSLVTAPVADVEAAASCAFPSGPRAARCVVQVSRASGDRAERRAEIRYRDAEDLAESLALLVSDILLAQFPDVVGAPRAAPAPGPAAPPAPPTPPPPSPSSSSSPPPSSPSLPSPQDEQARQAAERAHQAEMARQLELVKALQREADARAERQQREAAARAARERLPPEIVIAPRPRTHIGGEVGALAVFGLGPANPITGGGAARLMWSRALLRAGASLSLSGSRDTLAGHDLSFFRGLVAARAGVGLGSGIADVDLTAGPALLVLVDDAHAEGRHAVASLAFVAGPHLALRLRGPLALVIGADLSVALTEHTVVAGDTRVAAFSRAALEVTLGLAWRSQ